MKVVLRAVKVAVVKVGVRVDHVVMAVLDEMVVVGKTVDHDAMIDVQEVSREKVALHKEKAVRSKTVASTARRMVSSRVDHVVIVINVRIAMAMINAVVTRAEVKTVNATKGIRVARAVTQVGLRRPSRLRTLRSEAK